MKKVFYVFITVLLVGSFAAALYLKGDTLERKRAERTESSAVKPVHYVALGDSVASGLGAGSVTDTSGCGRTNAAYPYQIAERHSLKLVHLACSGASIEAGIAGVQTAAGEQSSQLLQLSKHSPDIITFGIGANDVAWLTLLSQCMTNECGTQEEKVAYENLLNSTFRPNLEDVLRKLDSLYGNNAQIIVLGYYQVFPASGANCPDIAGLSAPELQWGRYLRSKLNETISSSVRTTGVGKYIEPDFAGHELCTDEPYVQGIDDPAPYHGNAAGYTKMADQISEKINKN